MIEILDGSLWNPKVAEQNDDYWIDLSGSTNLADPVEILARQIGNISEIPRISIDYLGEAIGMWLDVNRDKAKSISITGLQKIADMDARWACCLVDVLRDASEWHALSSVPFETPQDWYEANRKVYFYVYFN